MSNQNDWYELIQSVDENTESIKKLSSIISNSHDYGTPVNIWFSLLVKENNEDTIMKYILLGGCIAEMVKLTKPDLYFMTRKLLTWSLYAASQRQISVMIQARITRLLKKWRENNLFGFNSVQSMFGAFKGIPPEYLGFTEFMVNVNNVVGICNSKVLTDITQTVSKENIKLLSEKEIEETLNNLKRESVENASEHDQYMATKGDKTVQINTLQNMETNSSKNNVKITSLNAAKDVFNLEKSILGTEQLNGNNAGNDIIVHKTNQPKKSFSTQSRNYSKPTQLKSPISRGKDMEILRKHYCKDPEVVFSDSE